MDRLILGKLATNQASTQGGEPIQTQGVVVGDMAQGAVTVPMDRMDRMVKMEVT